MGWLMERNAPSDAPFACSVDATLAAAGVQGVSFQIECNSSDPSQYVWTTYGNKRCNGTPKRAAMDPTVAIPFITGKCFRSTLHGMGLAPDGIWMKYNASLVEAAG